VNQQLVDIIQKRNNRELILGHPITQNENKYFVKSNRVRETLVD
jgi:RNase H-fold protein (predicted Holliday junction resolvase)